jgi:lipopolysaccharide biosynthesis protein
MLADPKSDMPFCLCWANENWTRRWDAAEHDVLLAQKYQPEDDLEFIKSLEPYLKDPRYIRINGSPLVIVYRPQHLPNSKKSIKVWRDYCKKAGIGKIHLACALTHGNWDHKAYGFDSGMEFPPHNINQKNHASDMEFHEPFKGMCFEYSEVAEMYLQNEYSEEHSGFRSVAVSWDNTARQGNRSVSLLNGTPKNYEYWLSQAIDKTAKDFPGEKRPVFINAWNEWAESAHLEPDRKYGHAFLEATSRAKSGHMPPRWPHVGIPEAARVKATKNINSNPRINRVQKSWKSRTWRKLRVKVLGR